MYLILDQGNISVTEILISREPKHLTLEEVNLFRQKAEESTEKSILIFPKISFEIWNNKLKTSLYKPIRLKTNVHLKFKLRKKHKVLFNNITIYFYIFSHNNSEYSLKPLIDILNEKFNNIEKVHPNFIEKIFTENEKVQTLFI